jgi:hypothetical protein
VVWDGARWRSASRQGVFSAWMNPRAATTRTHQPGRGAGRTGFKTPVRWGKLDVRDTASSRRARRPLFCQPPSLANDDHLDHLVQQLGLAAPEPREILLHDREHTVLVAAGLACSIGRDEHVLDRSQRRSRGQWLLGRDVERRAPDLPSGGRRRAPARRAALRRYAGGFMAERIGVDQALCFRRQRAGKGNEIGLRQHRL